MKSEKDDTLIRSLWEAISSAVTEGIDIDILQRIVSSQYTWLSHYGIPFEEYLNLYVVEVLEAAQKLEREEKLCERDLVRAAERARYQIRKYLRKLSEIRPDLDLNLIPANTHTVEDDANLAEQLHLLKAKIKTELDADDIHLLEVLLAGELTDAMQLLGVSASTLRKRVSRLRKKIEPWFEQWHKDAK